MPNEENRNALVAGSREAVSAWQAHSLLRYLFLAAAIAPLILAYIVVRDHELSWPRGELTAVVAIAAFGIIGYLGIIDRPGEPPGEIGLGIGWFLVDGGRDPDDDRRRDARRRHRAPAQATRSPLMHPSASDPPPIATSRSSSCA